MQVRRQRPPSLNAVIDHVRMIHLATSDLDGVARFFWPGIHMDLMARSADRVGFNHNGQAPFPHSNPSPFPHPQPRNLTEIHS